MKILVQRILAAWVCGLAVTSARATGPESSRAASLRGLADAPLYFEANRGQAGGAARFIARGRESAVLISPTEAVLLVTKTDRQQTRTVRLSLAGANAQAEVYGLDQLPGRANYF